MHDSLFFPLSGVLAAVMIFVASQQGASTLPTAPMSVGQGDRTLVAVQGVDLHRFAEAKRDTVTFIRAGEGQTYLRLTSRREAAFPADAQDVAHLRLATDLEDAFGGHPLTVIVRARSAPENGSPLMRVEYSSGSSGDSGWHDFGLSADYQDYRLTYTPPPSDRNLGLDFLGIWADPEGKGRGVEIERVVFDARG
jgi:hypothetical protein